MPAIEISDVSAIDRNTIGITPQKEGAVADDVSIRIFDNNWSALDPLISTII